jgi:lysophospholipase L1-like esterase
LIVAVLADLLCQPDEDPLRASRKSDPLFQSLNKTIATVTKAAKGHFADVFPAFNPQGNLTRERARICAFTFLCSEGDGHPTNAGYRAIAAAVWAASSYARRS